jgi:hypothetical protein
MRLAPLLPVALLLLAAAAPKPGDRTAAPAQTLGAMSPVDPLVEIERIAAEAAAHPLGSLANPVRVGGPEGALAYIARLRCPDGSRPAAGGSSTGGVGAYGSVTRIYPLDCRGGRSDLVVDLYHEEHVETRAPAGFALDSR